MWFIVTPQGLGTHPLPSEMSTILRLVYCTYLHKLNSPENYMLCAVHTKGSPSEIASIEPPTPSVYPSEKPSVVAHRCGGQCLPLLKPHLLLLTSVQGRKPNRHRY